MAVIGGAIAQKDRLLYLGRGPIGVVLPWLGFFWCLLGGVLGVGMLVDRGSQNMTWPAMGHHAEAVHKIAGIICYCIVMLFVPAMALSAALADLEDDRLELIALTPIGPLGFVFDKLCVALGFAEVILLLMVPLCVPALAAGALTPDGFLWLFALIFLSALLAAAFSVLVAVTARQATVAWLVTFLAIGLITAMPASSSVAGGGGWLHLSPWKEAFDHLHRPNSFLAASVDLWRWTAFVSTATLLCVFGSCLLLRRALVQVAAEGARVKKNHAAPALLALAGAVAIVEALAGGTAGPATGVVFCSAILWGLLGPILAAKRNASSRPGADPIAWKDRQLYRSGNLQVILGALFLANVAMCAWWSSRSETAGAPEMQVSEFVRIELYVLFGAALLLGATSLAWERIHGTFDLLLLSGLDMGRIATSKARAILLGIAPVWVFAFVWCLAQAVETRHVAGSPPPVRVVAGFLLILLPLFVFVWLGCAYGIAAKNTKEALGSFAGSWYIFFQWVPSLNAPGRMSWFKAIFSPFYFPRMLAEGETWDLDRVFSFLGWFALWGLLAWRVPKSVLAAARRIDPWGEAEKARALKDKETKRRQKAYEKSKAAMGPEAKP